MSFIETRNLTKIYEMGKHKIYAVNKVNLRIDKSEFIIVFGPSGSGKTTLLMLLGGLIKPTEGNILIDNQDITKFSESKLVKWRRENTGFVFQKINLISFLDVFDNIIVPLIPSSEDHKKIKRRVLTLIDKVGLSNRVNHTPSKLSVGEQQRVAIARALVTNPQIVFADEPTSHLDTDTGKKIVSLMKQLQDELKITFIVSTHDPELLSLADRTIKMRDGKIYP